MSVYWVVLAGLMFSLSAGLEFDLSTCGLGEKGCFFAPGCSHDDTCHAYVTYIDNGAGGIDFEFLRSGEGYITLGLNPLDTNMGDSLAFRCSQNPYDNSVEVGLSFNLGYSHYYFTDARNEMAGISLSSIQTEFVNNILRCKFTWSKDASTAAVGDEGQFVYQINDTVDFYLLQAIGPVTAEGLMDYHSDRYTTTSKVTLSSGSSVVGVEVVPFLIRFHGVLMSIAWVLLVSVGGILARFYKEAWPGVKIWQKPVWFTFHRLSMIMACLLTILAFSIIFVEKEGWSDLTGEPLLILNCHHIFGLITTALVITNPIMAAFRPDPGTPRRKIFNWAHWAVATAAHIIGVFCVITGLNLNAVKYVSPSWLTLLLLVFVATHVIISFILDIDRIHTIMLKAKKKKATWKSKLLKVLLWIYLAIVSLITAIVVIVLLVNGSY